MGEAEQSESSGAEIGKTVTLTQEDVREAARLLRLLSEPAILENGLTRALSHQEESGAKEPDRQVLIARAKIVLNGRRLRRKYFNGDLFGEPAWEILLALYITDQSEARLTTGKLAEWVDAPLSTVVRWVRTLEQESLIGRAHHPTDRRIVFIGLLDRGKKALDAYLRAIPAIGMSQI